MSNRAQNIIQLFEIFTGTSNHPIKLVHSTPNGELYRSQVEVDGVGADIFLVVDLDNGSIVPNWSAGTPGDTDSYSTSRPADRVSQRAAMRVFGILSTMIAMVMKKHGRRIKRAVFSGDTHDPGKNRLYRLFAMKVAQKYGGRVESSGYINKVFFD